MSKSHGTQPRTHTQYPAMAAASATINYTARFAQRGSISDFSPSDSWC